MFFNVAIGWDEYLINVKYAIENGRYSIEEQILVNHFLI